MTAGSSPRVRIFAGLGVKLEVLRNLLAYADADHAILRDLSQLEGSAEARLIGSPAGDF